MNQNPNFQSPEERAGILVFLIFMFLIAMLCYGSTVKAQQEPLMSVEPTYISTCALVPSPKSIRQTCNQTWYMHQEEEINKMTYVVL